MPHDADDVDNAQCGASDRSHYRSRRKAKAHYYLFDSAHVIVRVYAKRHNNNNGMRTKSNG